MKGLTVYFQLYPSLGQWRWRLRAANHRILANSGEAYHNRVDCLGAIRFVMGTNEQTPVYESPS